VIARTYYDPDEDAHAASPGGMERRLATMLDMLVALAHGSTVLADHLRVDPSARASGAHGSDLPHGPIGTQSVADEVPVDVMQKMLGTRRSRPPRSMCRRRNNTCSKKSPAVMRGAQNAVRQRSSGPIPAFL
jgi:hypothetical protein